ncbi:hypothetical protein BH23GEM9_BH23GEM9_21240 [soil metagenome]
MRVRLTALGEFRFEGGDAALPRHGKLPVLLVLLARRSPAAVRREELAALLWGDRPEPLARQSLRHALLRLRRAVGDDVLHVTAEHAELLPAGFELDVAEFEAAVAEDRPGDAVRAWTGEFLAGCEQSTGGEARLWLDVEREYLRRKYAHALEQLVTAAELRADWDEAARLAGQWALATPQDEAAQVRRLRLLRLAGRTADARAEYAAVLHSYREELGTEPGAELLRMRAELESPARAAGSADVVPRTPAMIGRGAAFETLVSSWRLAESGATVAVMVEGDEGSGMTRLLDEFAAWQVADAPAALVLRAVASPEEPRATARALLADLRLAGGLSGGADTALAEVAELVPSIRERFPHLPPATGTPAALERALIDVLADVAAEQPVLIVLDDLHTADADSVQLVSALLERAPGGVMVVVTGRSHRVTVAGSEPSSARLRRVLLQPLDGPELASLVDSMLPMAAPDRGSLVQRLIADAGGNPFYTVELVHGLAAERRLRPDGEGMWRWHPPSAEQPLPLPASVRAAVGRRLNGLGAEARCVLEAAAVLPSGANPATLAAVSGLQDDALDRALSTLVARRLLREDPPLVRCVPEIVRRAIHGALPPRRREVMQAAAAVAAAAPASAGAAMTAGAANVSSRGAWFTRARPAIAAALVVFTLAALTFLRPPRSEPLPTLAIGELLDFSAADSGGAAIPLADLLATRLARLPTLGVVSPERMHELSAQLVGLADDPDLLETARRAGATQIVQGSLYSGPLDGLRLELRRVDLRTGAVVAGYIVDAADAVSLVDGVVAEIGAEFGLTVPSNPDRSTSIVAYRMYEEGLRAYYRGDARSAHHFFSAALAEDSTFVMAAFYDWSSQYWAALLGPDSHAQLARIVQQAADAPDRERLLISALWADHVRAPANLALADTLVIRYPLEPDGHYLIGRARSARGDFLGAIPHFERVVAMDSGGFSGTSLRCRSCDAMAEIVAAFTQADSLPAAERNARRWTRLQPHAARPWVYLASGLEYQARYDEALAARRAAMPYQPANRTDPVYPAIIALRQGDFAAADRQLIDRTNHGSTGVAAEAAWFLTISLRQQGRLDDALRVARASDLEIAEQVVLMEKGEAMRAAEAFAVLARDARDDETGLRSRIWRLTHAASAHALAADTATLRALADTLARLGSRSGHGRDQRLHHYVRGRSHALAGDHAAAVHEFEQAIHSRTSGYGLLNLHHARSLNALGRPLDAVELLRASLRGPLDAGNYYVSHTELRAELGLAYDAARMPDSAAAQYRRVLNAWQRADATFDTRRDTIRSRNDALIRSLASKQ